MADELEINAVLRAADANCDEVLMIAMRLQNVLEKNVAKRTSNGSRPEAASPDVAPRHDGGWKFDLQDNEFARVDYEYARGYQRKSNDEHDECCEYEAAEEE